MVHGEPGNDRPILSPRVYKSFAHLDLIQDIRSCHGVRSSRFEA